jgi:superfamily II RNA helicase
MPDRLQALMPSLASLVPERGLASDDALGAFLTWVTDQGVEPYPAQEEAILELYSGNHVVLKTPTGSGKSLVALALHFREFSAGRRSVYTAPIKALVSEKFFQLCDAFGAEWVGMMTGDATVNETAPIICCTAEVLSQMALRLGADTPFSAAVMDEFHYYADRDRGMAWQIPLLLLPRTQFLLMSATLGDTEAIEEDLTARTGRPAKSVSSTVRPVPLEFHYSETPIHETLSRLVHGSWAPVYVVHFAQRAAAELAQALLSTDFCKPEEKAALAQALKGFRFDSPYGSDVRRMLLHGVGIHHAGLLPKYRLLVEKLSQQGLLKVICGTDTLGVGINVPIRTVLFTQLCKYDGEKVEIVSVRDFHQIAGRAGRKGFDDQGLVVVQAPDWVIENKRLEEAVESGQKNKKKFVRRKQPDRGYKHWDRETFDRLVTRQPETLVSRFVVDHGLVLTLLQKGSEAGADGFAELLDLIERSHEPRKAKDRWKEQSVRLRDALAHVGVLERAGDGWRVAPGLQREFSLHHSLSLFLVHALTQLEPEATVFELVSLVEAILEQPMPVLVAQVNREKGELVAMMKAQGVPYEERMEALEEVTWPKPRAEWIYATFNAYAELHPWVAPEHIRPKSVVREMSEQLVGFADYVKGLGVERSEGVLLRYLTQAYKALLQNVPEPRRTPELYDVLGYLRAMLGRVDDSLVTEWEKLAARGTEVVAAERPFDISADDKAFRARVRAEMHALVRALARADWAEAALSLRPGSVSWTAEEIEKALAPYLETYGKIVFDGRARAAWNTVLEPTGPHQWRVSQVLVDDDEDNAWSIDGVVDLRADTDPSGPIVEVLRIGE